MRSCPQVGGAAAAFCARGCTVLSSEGLSKPEPEGNARLCVWGGLDGFRGVKWETSEAPPSTPRPPIP